MNLKDAVDLARNIKSIPDRRPVWYKKLPSASDDTALYYKYFYELSHKFAPPFVLEIGTYLGSSSAHLASNDLVKVVTIDINSDATKEVQRFQFSNICALTIDVNLYTKQLNDEKTGEIYDVLFIDANHTFNDMYGQYVMLRPFVKNGGLIFFDDIHINPSTKDMDVAWGYVLDPKADISELHYTGFGVCQKDSSIQVPAWTEIIAEATSKMNLG